MEYTSQQELYNSLLPVFNVKKRLISNSKYKDITNEEIWVYLIETKWKKSHNLSLGEIVNDIITLEIDLLSKEREKI